MRREMTGFTLMILVLLLATWLVSGTRFIDWAYGMPDLGPLDDWTLAVLDKANALQARLGPGDLFGALRAWLHGITGLDQS
jgi:hypothetical protein